MAIPDPRIVPHSLEKTMQLNAHPWEIIYHLRALRPAQKREDEALSSRLTQKLQSSRTLSVALPNAATATPQVSGWPLLSSLEMRLIPRSFASYALSLRLMTPASPVPSSRKLDGSGVALMSALPRI